MKFYSALIAFVICSTQALELQFPVSYKGLEFSFDDFFKSKKSVVKKAEEKKEEDKHDAAYDPFMRLYGYSIGYNAGYETGYGYGEKYGKVVQAAKKVIDSKDKRKELRSNPFKS